jgi:ribosome maturation factor RimP
MSTPERVRALVEPLVADLHLELYDLEYSGGVVRVTVDQPGGVGMDAIASLTRALSRAFDEQDPIDGHFTLEVSSPGLERTLRIPAHFATAVGTRVSVKAIPHLDGARRFTGTLERAGEDDIDVLLDEPAGAVRTIAYDEIERARTVFEWGPAPKPGKAPKGQKQAKGPKPVKARAAAPKSPVPEKKVDAP